MDKILLRPIQSDATYHGRFADLAFGPLASPIAVYKNLLKHLGKYGASLQDLKIDATVLSEANISCYIPNLGTLITLRLDRLLVNFVKLHEIGEELAKNVVLDSWKAVRESDESIEVAQHEVLIQLLTQIEGAPYDTLIKRYLTPVLAPAEKANAGVVFYSAANSSKGELSGSIVLDRWVGQEQGLLLKVGVVFDAKHVSFDALYQRIDEYLTGQLDRLGLKLDRGHAG